MTAITGARVNIAARLEQLCEPGWRTDFRHRLWHHLQGKFGLPSYHYTGEQNVRILHAPCAPIASTSTAAARPLRLRLWPDIPGVLGWVVVLVAIVLVAGTSWYAFLQPSLLLSVSEHFPRSLSCRLMKWSETRFWRTASPKYIISMLSRVPDLKVVARSSSFTYKGEPIDVRKVERNSALDARPRRQHP